MSLRGSSALLGLALCLLAWLEPTAVAGLCGALPLLRIATSPAPAGPSPGTLRHVGRPGADQALTWAGHPRHSWSDRRSRQASAVVVPRRRGWTVPGRREPRGLRASPQAPRPAPRARARGARGASHFVGHGRANVLLRGLRDRAPVRRGSVRGTRRAPTRPRSLLADLMLDTSPVAAHRTAVGEFLRHCDLAKFAGWSLSQTDIAALLASAETFVLATAPVAPSHNLVRAAALRGEGVA